LFLNSPCILELSKLCGAFLVHLFLNNSTLLTVTFVDLLQNISLVVLLDEIVSDLLLFGLGLNPLNLLVDKLLLVLNAPLLLIGMGLAGANRLGAVLVDLLHEIDAGLILLLPLVLPELPLLLALEPGQVLDQLLLGLLVLGLLVVVLLKIDDFLASTEALFLFHFLDGLLAADGPLEHLFVAGLLSLKLLLAKRFLGVVVPEELHIALSVENVLLALEFPLGLVFLAPLSV